MTHHQIEPVRSLNRVPACCRAHFRVLAHLDDEEVGHLDAVDVRVALHGLVDHRRMQRVQDTCGQDSDLRTISDKQLQGAPEIEVFTCGSQDAGLGAVGSLPSLIYQYPKRRPKQPKEPFEIGGNRLLAIKKPMVRSASASEAKWRPNSLEKFA